MVNLTVDQRHQINKILDKLLEDYFEDHRIIFRNDSEQLGLHFGIQKESLKEWSTPRQCIFQKCLSQSIKRSHSIQKSGPLQAVAAGKNLLTPKLNQKTGAMELVEISIAEASVFPGFCEMHERIFESFEKKKKIETPDEIVKQIYRSICREIVRLELGTSKASNSIFKMTSIRNERLREIFISRLPLDLLQVLDTGKIQIGIEEDPLFENVQKWMSDTSEALLELKNGMLGEIEAYILGQPHAVFQPVVVEVKSFIPLALSGLGSFYIQEGETQRRILVFIGVFPSSDQKSTKLVIHGRSSDEEHVHRYAVHYHSTSNLIGMVEQWMIRGTDHWFLKKEVWEKKSEKDREDIYRELVLTEKGLYHPLDFSIFDF